MGLGLTALFVWHPAGKLSHLDALLSPFSRSGSLVGSKVEDSSQHPYHGDKSVREITPALQSDLNYLVCEVDDDPEQLNAFGLYHPTDIAITLANLKSQGIEHLFISTHLHWPSLETEEKNTLTTAMQGYSSIVISAPVRRSLTAQPLTPAFYRASVPASSAVGSTALLPAVNSLSVTPDISFPENTLAGFSAIESEEETRSMPLVARWGDRLIFSSPLLALTQRSGVSPNQLTVHPGKYIRVGNAGNVIPIDEFGHYQPAQETLFSPARRLASAKSGTVSIIGATQTFAILTATGESSSQFEAVGTPFQKLSQLADTPRVTSSTTLRRLPLWLECILIVDIAMLGAWLAGYRGLRRHIYFLISLLCTAAILSLLPLSLHYWTPLSLHALPLAAGWLLSLFFSKLQTPTRPS